MRFRGLAAAAIALAGIGSAASGQSVTEFPLPAPSTEVLDITRGPDGNLWFTEPIARRIGRIDPSGAITEFPLPPGDYRPERITSGADRNLWFTEVIHAGGPFEPPPPSMSRIGRITPSGQITEFPLGNGIASDISGDGAGNIWIGYGERIGRLTTEGKLVRLIPVDGLVLRVASGSDPFVWFARRGAIERLTFSGAAEKFLLADPEASVEGLEVGLEGDVWFSELSANGGRVGRITGAGALSEEVVPNGQAPGDVTLGVDQSLWFTEMTNPRVGRRASSGVISEVSISTIASGIALGGDGNVWFTEMGKIGRISSGHCPGSATVLCLGDRFQVEAHWRSSNIGGGGAGGAVSLTSDTGAFWFFQPSNIELVVKVLDGRTVNGKSWVFYGALSNVEYTITVTDTATGTVKTYFNPEGTLASVADTDAF